MESNLADNPRLDRRCENLTYGVAHSQNAIIAKLVHQKLEPPDLARAAVALGFHGDTPAWALGGRAGTVTMPDGKGVPFGKTAAGFTGSELSPMAGAILASTIANHGVAVTPRIVDAIVDGTTTIPVEPGKSRQAIDARVADHVANMMQATCVAGSAAKAFRRWGGKRVGGKTGTLAVDKPVYEEFSWFVGFVDDGTGGALAISVLLGNAEDWWMKAHTAARRVLDRAAR
jgi:membrane peptidoglycan carboxypeptidase